MEKIRIMQNAVTFITNLTVEEIKLLQKQAPSALAISEPTPEGYQEEIFRVSHKNAAFGDINDSFITFVDATAEGKACLTVLIPANETDKKSYLYERYATAINYLKTVERNAKKALNNLVISKEAFAEEFIDLDTEVSLTEALEEADIIIAAKEVKTEPESETKKHRGRPAQKRSK